MELFFILFYFKPNLRLDVRVKPLFSVDVIIERKSSTKIEFLIKAKSNFKSKSTANNVEVFEC